ncbi:peptide/nickel transport system substrate-binding protein [Rhizobiales bacterium GAS113]|nr:peptide/nickel transport system substrate-binding protein [Rhizobiales bacterium GAS113]
MTLDLTRRQTLQFGALLFAGASFPTLGRAADAPKNLIVAIPQSPAALEPVLKNNTATVQTIFSVYDRLLAIDFKTGEVRPGLAESWEKIDPRTFEFKLRQGVKFHDGGEMTAEDVAFSFSKERISGPKDGISVAAQYHRTIEKVELVDPNTVRFTTNQIDPAFLLKVGGWSAEIVSKKAFEAGGGWKNWATKPIGAGPYKIVENRQDEILILDAHKDYWGGSPAFERIEFRIVPEAVVRVNGLLAGDFHIATSLNPDQIDQVNAAPGLEIVGGPIQNVRTLNFATSNGILKDVRLRRAISHAIDRDGIVQSIWQNRTVVPHGFQDPAYGNTYLDDARVPTYDPDLAHKLIAEAGYKGEEIVYRSQSSAYPLELQTSQIIVEMLRDVGLNVRLEVKESWDQVYTKPIESIIWNESTLFAWPDPTGGLIRLYGSAGQFQRDPFNWSADEFNKVAGEFESTDDLKKRQELHRRLLDIVEHENPPCTVLFDNALFYGKRKNIPWAPYPTLYVDYGPNNAATKVR